MPSSSRNGMNCQTTLIIRLPWSPLPHALSTFSLPHSLPHLSVQVLFSAAQKFLKVAVTCWVDDVLHVPPQRRDYRQQ
ncbi:hypothetical protein T01_6949 [Trichinella spiralis]|uniref:Uncharacterized protein n=1 Tax=Trichinella spiralis TaxID=6334 RepID=A0A0V0Z349_TRISP|nr:hypothetical protein T01_6949 [Trichinella spiralis]